jgi:hypothetical protein
MSQSWTAREKTKPKTDTARFLVVYSGTMSTKNENQERADAHARIMQRNLEGLKFVGVSDEVDEFSRCECDGCGTRLGGSRHRGSALTEDGIALELDFCIDCAFMLANGQLPDM